MDDSKIEYPHIEPREGADAGSAYPGSNPWGVANDWFRTEPQQKAFGGFC